MRLNSGEAPFIEGAIYVSLFSFIEVEAYLLISMTALKFSFSRNFGELVQTRFTLEASGSVADLASTDLKLTIVLKQTLVEWLAKTIDEGCDKFKVPHLWSGFEL